VLSIFFEEDIIPRWIFQILFSIGSNYEIEYKYVNTEKISSIADSNKKHCSEKDCLQNLGISSPHKQGQEKNEGYTIGHK